MSKRITAGTGITLGAILALPAGAQADDFTVTNLNDAGSGSLRDAIGEANLNSDSDRILFASSLSGTIDLTSGQLDIVGNPVEILGPGARTLTVDAQGGAGRAFSVYAGTGDEAVISGLTVNGNNGFIFGGAIFHGTGQLTIERSTITGGQASSGGGLFNNNNGDGTNIVESTISGNTATADGGGFYNDAVDLEIRNSTISGNEAANQGGGGWLALSDPTTALIANSTLTANRAGANFGGGALYENSNGATIRGSIIAGNSDGDGTAPNLDDGEWSTSFSLIDDTSGAGIEDDGGNLLDVDPLLGSLADNGGPTDTHALAKASPAINAGPSDAPGSDQRGAPRKGRSDIGAYEFTKCAGVIINRVGTDGKDKLKGTSGKDGILGLGGKDKLSGKGKKDGLCGQGGKDTLKGGGGKDKLKGGPGKDKLVGGKGKDKLNGGPGKDKEIQ